MRSSTDDTFDNLMLALGVIIIAAWGALFVLAIVRDETILAGLAGVIIGIELMTAAEGARRRRRSR